MKLIKMVNGRLVIAPELLAIPCFTEIWEGDMREDKAFAFAELTYVYYMHGFDSPYIKYKEREREEAIVDNFKLHQLYEEAGGKGKWTASPTLNRCIIIFMELQKTPASESLIELTNTLHTSNALIRLMRMQIEDYMKEIAKAKAEAVEGVVTPLEMKEALETMQKLIKLAHEVPKTIGVMEDLYTKAIKAREEAEIYGGDDLGMFEDPSHLTY